MYSKLFYDESFCLAEFNKIKNSLKANSSTTPETVSSTKSTTTKAVMPKKPAPVKPIVPALPNLD
jgi:hypothetical protein